MNKPFKLQTLLNVIDQINERRMGVKATRHGRRESATMIDVVGLHAPRDNEGVAHADVGTRGDTDNDDDDNDDDDSSPSDAPVRAKPAPMGVSRKGSGTSLGKNSSRVTIAPTVVEEEEEKGLAGRAPGTDLPNVATSTRGGGSGGGGVLSGQKLLVVDDSVPILKLMTNVLRSKGKAEVVSVKDGNEAVDRFVADASDTADGGDVAPPFFAVLTDIQMPNMDGFEECRRIRAYEKEHGMEPCIVVGISANGLPSYAEEAEQAGMDAFMAKVRVSPWSLPGTGMSLRRCDP
jgi:CheY-like chemotaxis protein